MKKMMSDAQRNMQVSFLALALAAAVPAAAHGHDQDYEVRREAAPQVHGQVEIVHETPGGAVRVGVEVGHPRPVVVEDRKVVVVREESRPREVTVIRRVPEPTVEIIRESPSRTVIIKRDGYGRIINKTIVEKKRHGRHGREYEERHEERDDGYYHDDGREIHDGFAHGNCGHGGHNRH